MCEANATSGERQRARRAHAVAGLHEEDGNTSVVATGSDARHCSREDGRRRTRCRTNVTRRGSTIHDGMYVYSNTCTARMGLGIAAGALNTGGV